MELEGGDVFTRVVGLSHSRITHKVMDGFGQTQSDSLCDMEQLIRFCWLYSARISVALESPPNTNRSHSMGFYLMHTHNK